MSVQSVQERYFYCRQSDRKVKLKAFTLVFHVQSDMTRCFKFSDVE